jgi:hypothetical protein
MARVAALGRALAAPFTSLGGWYVATARARPFLTGVVTSGVKTSFADAFAQKVRTRSYTYTYSHLPV